MKISTPPSNHPDSVEEHARCMRAALDLAQKAHECGEVPIGAVVVLDGSIIGCGHNQTVTACDPTAHAEIVAIRQAAHNQGNCRLVGARIYSTIEPCSMCAGAIVQARIKMVIYGADDPKGGGAGSVFNVLQNARLNHRCAVIGGILQAECSAIIQSFFEQKRQGKKAK